MAVAGIKGVPLVVHVHSTEFDRSGLHVDQRIYDIERRGMHGALKIIGAAYLVWLAWQLARAGSIQSMSKARPMRFHEAALFQYVNPKAWMMAVGARR